MIPYTYLIVNTITNQKYYGARWSSNCHPDDLWKTYFTSSKYVKQMIEEYGLDAFKFEIRKTFDDVDSCRKWESTVLRRLKVTTNENWINKNINGIFLPYGKQSQEQVKKRISKLKQTLKQNPRKLSEETKQKISKSSKGKEKPMTKEHIEKLHCHTNNSSIVTCPHCGKSGQFTNMKRWHFDRCKKNLNRLIDLDTKQVTCSMCGYTAKSSANFFKYHENNCTYYAHNV